MMLGGRSFQWVVPDLVKPTAIVSAASVGLSFLGLLWPGWADAPVLLRFVVGLIAFGVSPGLLVVGVLLARREPRISPGDFFVSVITCSFSCNLLFNFALFALKWSMAELTTAYLIVQALAYVGWAFARRRRGPLPEVVDHRPAVALGFGSVAWGVLVAVAMGSVTYVHYVNGSPPTNSEELVWLRKLAENPSVRFDNLSFRQGEPSTYLFVPFQILIVGTSTIAAADVAFTYSAFWAVSTALSLSLIARLAYVVFGQMGVVGLICGWMCAIAFFDVNAVTSTAGIAAPYPNRYGFAGGVLMPLTLVLFWSILRAGQFQAWRWALLVYVTLEMTFVHARETLLALGAMTAAFAIMAARPAGNRRHLGAIAGVIGVTGLVLFAYKLINLGVAPQLASYVADTTEACRVALARLIGEHRGTALLLADVPRNVVVGAGSETAMRLGLPNYQRLFVEPWTQSFPGRIYLPITFLILPLYAWHGRSIAELSLALALAGLGAIALSGVLTLLVSVAVGNPEVLDASNLIFLLGLLVFCSAAWSFGAWWAERLPGKRAGVSNGLTIAACLAMVCVSFAEADRVASFTLYLSGLWTRGAGAFLVAVTLASILYRLRLGAVPLFAPPRPSSPLGALVAVSLVLAVVAPAVRLSTTWEKSPFAPVHPANTFTGDLFRDYSRLSSTHKLDPSEYPIEVIRYLREDVPANQTILTHDALSLLQRVPHFAAVLSNRGGVAATYITNREYLREYSRSGSSFKLLPFFADDQGRRLFQSLLDEYRIDIVIVGPEETPGMRRAWNEHAALQKALRLGLEQDGYEVYLVNRQAGVR